jgi:hypothetical protein
MYRSCIATAVTALALLAPAAAHAQGLNGIVENYYPSQLTAGQTTTMSVAMNGGRNNTLTGVEITPSTGITVGALKAGDLKEGVIWWQVPITVAKDAAPGKRTLVAVGMNGKTIPVDVTIPDHTVAISDLKVTAAPANGTSIDFQFAAAEQGGGTLGTEVNVWFMLRCGKEPEVGIARGKVTNGVVRASIPNPKTITGAAAPTFGPKCDLQVRASDAAGVDSNTVMTTVEFK